jgi:transcriptional regulator of acetoin/glycerol metabolism
MSDDRRHGVGDDAVRTAKEDLIARGVLRGGETQPEWLAGEIDRSWRRSISAGATRATGAFHYVNAFDTDSELLRAAHPVLDRLESTLQDMGTAIFLADRTGQIVARRVAGRSERARFDDAYAAEGFDFSEDKIGTNGLGTPIQEGSAVFVRGAEHFNESLEQLACAGIGIRHPSTGRVVGSLSLAAPLDAAEMMMLAMAREGAQQIIDNLGSGADRREVVLGRSYQQHRTKGPVIVLNNDTVMTNVTGLSFLNVEMHARLWDALLAQDWADGPHELDLDLDDLQARVLAHRLNEDEDSAFAVEILDRRGPARVRSSSTSRRTQDAWTTELQRLHEQGQRTIAVTGPSGSGKLHAALPWLRSLGQHEAVVLDAGDLDHAPAWRARSLGVLRSGGSLVVRRLEDMPVAQVGALKALAEATAVQDAGATGGGDRAGCLILTADLGRCSEAVRNVLSQVAATVEMPGLASRREELPTIVEALLAPVEPRRRPILSAATMQGLSRWSWPGNIAELRLVLSSLAADHPGRVVSPYHLPERMWDSSSGRDLTRIEQAERAEILAALRQSGGNRSRAATMLGIGRTTLYRKLDALGIGDDALRS